MFNWIRDNIIAKLLKDSFKQIEKINWMTKALEICFKQKIFKDMWSQFLDSVDGLLDDAKEEVKSARTWN
ncbi:MAG: hypothetical protein SFH39_00495 [Candidatus Magnetobacterium sp. LHC-1]